MVAARLKGYIRRGLGQVGVLADAAEGIDFGMTFSKSSMPAFPQDLVVFNHDAAHHGVGPSGELSFLGKFKGPAHPALVAGRPTHEVRLTQACKVFCMSEAMVMGPTPPGTGVIQLVLGATAS